MGGSSFELLMQEIFNQKQRLEQLIEENEDLQRQLADLRAGRGIFLEICGVGFTLNGERIVATPQSISPTPAQDSPISDQPTMAFAQESASDQPTINMVLSQPSASDQPTVSMTLNQVSMETISEAPLPSIDEIEQLPNDSGQSDEKAEHASPSFLEEMLIDEFAAAATSPMSIWRGTETKKLPPIDEDEKAILRRELIGSFLLE